MTECRAVIFDVNGTLLGYDDPLGFERRFAQACADLGSSVDVEQVVSAFARLQQEWAWRREAGIQRASNEIQYRRTMTWVYRLMLKALQLSGDLHAMADALYERFVVREGFMPLLSDVHSTLVILQRRGLRLGILSNFPPHLEETLKTHGIHGYFGFFVVSSLVGLEKPDPAIFELAIERAGVPRESILLVGDDPHDDVYGAQAVGLAAVLVDRQDRYPQGDTARIRSLSQLCSLGSGIEPWDRFGPSRAGQRGEDPTVCREG